jgi:hypothetical protein
MSEFVPESDLCTMCDSEAVDPTDTHPLCETHLKKLEESRGGKEVAE